MNRDSVNAVGFIHIGLDFLHKGGKIIFHRIDKSRIRPSGRGWWSFPRNAAKDFHTEVGQG